MFNYSKCDGCIHNGCGRGSEPCDAVIGDYCPASESYIEETEEEKNQDFSKKVLTNGTNCAIITPEAREKSHFK